MSARQQREPQTELYPSNRSKLISWNCLLFTFGLQSCRINLEVILGGVGGGGVGDSGGGGDEDDGGVGGGGGGGDGGGGHGAGGGGDCGGGNGGWCEWGFRC